MKKIYRSPATVVVALNEQTSLMAASGKAYEIEGLDDLEVSGTEWSGGASLSRRGNLWDDEDIED